MRISSIAAVSGSGAVSVPTETSFLVIAGGGGAGSGGNAWGSGGGAGGYRSSWNSETSGGGGAAESAHPVSVGTSYTVTVGAGGAIAPGSPLNASPGSASVFSSITTVGGGYGVGYGGGNGGPGGSGGGGSAGDGPRAAKAGGSGTANQGYAGGVGAGSGGPGGNSGGGGGGAGSVGGGAPSPGGSWGSVGAGVPSTITGSDVTRAKGSTSTFLTKVAPDGPNSGGGGANGYPGSASAGDSGVVILRFNGKSPTIGAGLTYTETTVGGDTVLTFTAGTDTISW